MTVHIRNGLEWTALCGVSIRRRWWVSGESVVHGTYAGVLPIQRQVDPRDSATCRACKEVPR